LKDKLGKRRRENEEKGRMRRWSSLSREESGAIDDASRLIT